MKTIMLLGVKTEILDADNLRNAIWRLNQKVRKLVSEEIAKSPDPNLGIKGYVTQEKINKTFEKSSAGVKASGYESFASTLEEFLEPFTRQKDAIENINTALADLLGWFIAENASEARLAKVMDTCAKRYEHKKASLAEEAAMTEVSTKLIAGLVDIFEIRSEIQGETLEHRKVAQTHFDLFIGKVKEMVAAEQSAAAPSQKVLNVDFPRRDGPVAKAE